MAFGKFIPDRLQNSGLDIRSRTFAVLMPFLPLFGCSEDGATSMEVAIVAPEHLSDKAENICLNVVEGNAEKGEKICDPEWREMELSGECVYDEDGNILDCEPDQVIGAWVYTFPVADNEWNCYDFENLPAGYLPATRVGGVLSPIEKYCFIPIVRYEDRGPKPDFLFQVNHVGQPYYLIPNRNFFKAEAS